MPKNAIMVFTGRPPDQIIAEGGSQAWALDARRARMCDHVVCVQNRNTYEHFSPTEPHNTAFMIAKITEVSLAAAHEQPDPSENKPERYIIKFREFAPIARDVEALRKGNRNPVSYIDLMDIGIDKDTLKFSEISRDVEAAAKAPIEDQPLSMAEAKKGLALTFGVSPDAIEITIRG